jgi:modulator of FtsH protease
MVDLAAWHDALITTAGAAATLAGLILAAMSVSISAILKIPSMPSRAGSSIGSLVAILVVSIAALVPQTTPALGVEVLVVSAACLVMHGQTSWRQLQDRPAQSWRRIVPKVALSLTQAIPLVVSGVLLTQGAGAGVFWLIAASLLVFIGSTVNAWVMLVEIRR